MSLVREIPEIGALKKCLVCAVDKPWGIFDQATGAAVCVDCRDARTRLAAAQVALVAADEMAAWIERNTVPGSSADVLRIRFHAAKGVGK